MAKPVQPHVVMKSGEVNAWIDSLDARANAVVLTRIDRVERGLFGDVEAVGEGVSELRIDFGPGYRLYFTKRRDTVVFLLVGGTKSTQKADIKAAKAMAKEIP